MSKEEIKIIAKNLNRIKAEIKIKETESIKIRDEMECLIDSYNKECSHSKRIGFCFNCNSIYKSYRCWDCDADGLI